MKWKRKFIDLSPQEQDRCLKNRKIIKILKIIVLIILLMLIFYLK